MAGYIYNGDQGKVTKMKTPAEQMAEELKKKFDLSHRCCVNLEGAIRGALLNDVDQDILKNLLEDVLENIEFRRLVMN